MYKYEFCEIVEQGLAFINEEFEMNIQMSTVLEHLSLLSHTKGLRQLRVRQLESSRC